MNGPGRRVAATALAVGLIACGRGGERLRSSPGPSSDLLRTGIERGALVLTNPGRDSVYLFVVEEQLAAAIEWAPCTRSDSCDRMRPGERRVIPRGRIAGWDDGDDAVLVFHWLLLRAPSGVWLPDSVRTLTVRLSE